MKRNQRIIAMPAKTQPPRQKSKRPSDLSFAYRLEKLMGDQLALMRRLEKFIEEMEDEEDHRAIELAKKENAGKPSIPWVEAKKRLGLD
jgi:hypothetical protein